MLSGIKNWFARHWGWLRWLLAALVLAFLFRQHGESFRTLEWSQIHGPLLLAGFALCFASLLMTYFRWFLLVWALDIPFRMRDAVRLGCIGYLFNYVAPGAVGGDLIKATMIAREQKGRRLIAVGTVFLDRLIGMAGLLILGGLMMLIQTDIVSHLRFQYVVGVFQIGSLAILVGGVIVLLPGLTELSLLKRILTIPKIGPILEQIINSLRLYQTRWKILVIALVLSVISHAGLIFSIYCCALAMHESSQLPSLLVHLQIIPPAELVGVIVPLPGGTGALEEAVAYFYEMAGAKRGHGFITAIAYRVVTIFVAIVGAVWYFLSRREIDEILDEELPETPPEESSETDDLMADHSHQQTPS